MADFTREELDAMGAYRRPFIERINELDIVTELQLQRAPHGGYICPVCGSGSGEHGTGAMVTNDHRHITCFANASCKLNGGGQGQDIFGALQATTGKTADEILKERFADYDVTSVLRGRARSQGAANAAKSAPQEISAKDGAAKPDAVQGIVAATEPDYTAYYERCIERLTDAAAVAYLKARGISVNTARRAGIGFDPDADPASAPGAIHAEYRPHPAPRIIIPSGKSQYVGRRIDGGDDFAKINSKGGKAGLFNERALYAQGAQEVFIVEGAFDALSVLEAGAQAIALNSTSNVDRLLNKLEARRPDSAVTLIVCLDADDAGKAAADKLTDGLRQMGITFVLADTTQHGRYKDQNDFLVADRDAFFETIGRARAQTRERPDSTALYVGSGLMASEIRRAGADVHTGFERFDRATGGLYPGLTILAGASSLGKTSIALQMADQLAAGGQDTIFFSLEQSRLELVCKSIARFAAMAGNTLQPITALSIRKGNREEAVQDATRRYLDAVGDRLSIVEGNFDCSVDFVRDYVTTYMRKTGTRPVVFVDYTQILRPADGTKTTKEAIDAVVTGLKRMSRDLNLSVIALSSINRANYLSKVDFSSLKESGGLEYSADVVLGLDLQILDEDLFFAEKQLKAQRERYKEAKSENPRRITLTVLKNRFGAVGFEDFFEYYPDLDYFLES